LVSIYGETVRECRGQRNAGIYRPRKRRKNESAETKHPEKRQKFHA